MYRAAANQNPTMKEYQKQIIEGGGEQFRMKETDGYWNVYTDDGYEGNGTTKFSALQAALEERGIVITGYDSDESL